MLVRRTTSWGPVIYQSLLLNGLGIPHAFTTRLGGVSEAPFDSLNLGNPNGCPIQDTVQNIDENNYSALAAIAVGERYMLRVHQIHGAAIAVHRLGERWDYNCKADAIVVTDPGEVASVRVADCVPVLLAAENGSAAAAVHAGWRGVIAGVVPKAVAALQELSPGGGLIAAIGPCIGFDAFEVGPEVLAEFESAFGPAAPIRRRSDGKGHVDLRQAIALQLTKIGLSPDQIDTTDRCTYRDSDEFFSHRREYGVTGRMAALIGLP